MFDYKTSRALQEHRYSPTRKPPRDGTETTGLGSRRRARLLSTNGLTAIAFRLRSIGQRIQHSTK
jgi:hypothetical protein